MKDQLVKSRGWLVRPRLGKKRLSLSVKSCLVEMANLGLAAQKDKALYHEIAEEIVVRANFLRDTRNRLSSSCYINLLSASKF